MNQGEKSGKGLEALQNSKEVKAVKEMVKTCIQCGTCTGSCPNAQHMDITPRKMWRQVLTDRLDQVFASRTFILCSSCYTCSLRCPRGLELTAAMALLKQAAARADLVKFRRSTLFYKTFLDNVRQHGRVKETELMAKYFLALKNPMVPLGFTPLGLQLLARGKLKPEFSFQGAHKLDALFEKIERLEELEG